MSKKWKIPKVKIDARVLKAAGAGAIAAVLLFSMFRFIVVTEAVHYHANFALFINGERENFEGDLYYEEVQACSAEAGGPRTRVHMHQPDNNVVHVHDAGATWGNFFENLGWTLNNRFVANGTEIYDRTEDKQLIFVLNGQRTQNIANKVIGDEDRLLISYGDESTKINAQYDQVEDTAPLFNLKPDPSACKGSDNESFVERLGRALFE